jgi:serine/threonine protein kinase
LSWVTRISRTRLSTVDGLAFSENSEATAIHNLEGVLRAVQKLKIKRCSYEDIEQIQKIGQGETFSVDECKFEGTSVAVKHVRLESTKEDGYRREIKRRLQSVLREILIMHHAPLAGHPNILTLLGYGWKLQQGSPLPYVVVEYGAGGSLRSYLASHSIPPRAKTILGGDVASGLMALHQCGIVHGDVKLDNVVVFHSWDRPSATIAKICDFGHSILLTGEDNAELKYYGTTLYVY